MSQVTPEDQTPTRVEGAEGKAAALAVWILFALTPLTMGLTAIIGVIIAYTRRDRASGLIRAHLDSQISLFWSALIWTILFTLAWGISLALTTVFIGIPLVFLFWAAGVLLGVWFTIRSVLGALALYSDRAP
ncbi:MAG: hypothetical protein EON88_04210 [Brevundimonas sp.]|nr:MAG: hypothetical protein EON88_04210 [Brevundimonas sp.]